MGALAAILANFGPILQLAMMAVQTVQQLAPQAPVPPSNEQKKSAAVTAMTAAIAAAAPVDAQIQQVHAALQSQDSAAIGNSIGHSIELALSICKSFGIFSKAGVVQNAAPLPGTDSGASGA